MNKNSRSTYMVKKLPWASQSLECRSSLPPGSCWHLKSHLQSDYRSCKFPRRCCCWCRCCRRRRRRRMFFRNSSCLQKFWKERFWTDLSGFFLDSSKIYRVVIVARWRQRRPKQKKGKTKIFFIEFFFFEHKKARKWKIIGEGHDAVKLKSILRAAVVAQR